MTHSNFLPKQFIFMLGVGASLLIAGTQGEPKICRPNPVRCQFDEYYDGVSGTCQPCARRCGLDKVLNNKEQESCKCLCKDFYRVQEEKAAAVAEAKSAWNETLRCPVQGNSDPAKVAAHVDCWNKGFHWTVILVTVALAAATVTLSALLVSQCCKRRHLEKANENLSQKLSEMIPPPAVIVETRECQTSMSDICGSSTQETDPPAAETGKPYNSLTASSHREGEPSGLPFLANPSDALTGIINPSLQSASQPNLSLSPAPTVNVDPPMTTPHVYSTTMHHMLGEPLTCVRPHAKNGGVFWVEEERQPLLDNPETGVKREGNRRSVDVHRMANVVEPGAGNIGSDSTAVCTSNMPNSNV